MSSNESSIVDKDGDSSDWLEIYNSSNQILNLEDFSISDDIKSLDKWKFPIIDIYPQNFLLIFCIDCPLWIVALSSFIVTSIY